MSRLLLTFYGDDFTGSTDALEQLTLAGIRTALFIEPPTASQLRKYPGLEAVGVAGMTRSMKPPAMARQLRPALMKLKSLGARHVHYKVCSTFDSSPAIGNIGKVMEVAANIFSAPFIPLLAAAPALGRHTIFGTHFARYGIGSAGQIHRLDRHPSVSHHPVTPMREADLRLHLAKQTKAKIALFDVLKVGLPEAKARTALKELLKEKPAAVLFDAVDDAHLKRIGELIDEYASEKRALFSIGSSGIEMALAGCFKARRGRRSNKSVLTSAATVLVGSGSCSPVTGGQIEWALKHGFAEVVLEAMKLTRNGSRDSEMERAVVLATRALEAGRSVIVHTSRAGADCRVTARLKHHTASILGTALGTVLREVVARSNAPRICVAGGDTSSFAARAMGIEGLEMIAPLTPGAPLCRVTSRFATVDGREVVFKGGQVGAENYFEVLKRGKV